MFFFNVSKSTQFIAILDANKKSGKTYTNKFNGIRKKTGKYNANINNNIDLNTLNLFYFRFSSDFNLFAMYGNRKKQKKKKDIKIVRCK